MKFAKPIILLLTLGLVHIYCEPSCFPQFKCNPIIPTNYEVHGTNLTCPAGYVCNADYILTSCDPCVPLNEQTCGFTCSPNIPNQGEFNSKPVIASPKMAFTCSIGMVCNSLYLNSCAPCIDIVCSKSWTCNINDPTAVTISGLSMRCMDGKVCNKDYKYPCDACIFDSTFPTTTTTTSKPTPPAQYPPNCNDGFGGTVPCRPGPPGGFYYYKCFPVGMSFDFRALLCSNIALDSCRHYPNICK